MQNIKPNINLDRVNYNTPNLDTQPTSWSQFPRITNELNPTNPFFPIQDFQELRQCGNFIGQCNH